MPAVSHANAPDGAAPCLPAPRRRGDAWLLLGALLLGTAVRFAGLGDEPLWLDEATTAAFAARAPLDAARAEVQHPPLHTLLTLVALRVGSSPPTASPPADGASVDGVTEDVAPDVVRAARASNATIRLPAALAGVLLIPALAFLVRRLARPELARASFHAAAFLVAGAPFLVNLSQEARNFSLYALLSVLATSSVLALLEPAAHAEGRGARRGMHSGARLSVYAVLSLLAMATHHLAALVLLAHEVWFWSAWRRARREGRVPAPSARAWLLARAAAVAAYVPWIVWVVRRLSSGAETLQERAWIGSPFERIPYGFFRFVVGYGPWPESSTSAARERSEALLAAGPLVALLLLPFLVLLVQGLSAARWAAGQRARYGLLVLLPLVLLVPLTPLVRLVHERYLCYVGALALVPVALALAALGARGRWLLGGALAATFLVGLWTSGPRALRYGQSPERYGKEAWDRAAAYVAEQDAALLVLAPGYVALAFERAWLQRRSEPGARAVPEPERRAWPAERGGAGGGAADELPRVRAGQRVALVLSHLGDEAQARLLAQFPASGPDAFEPVAERSFPEQAGIRVRVFRAVGRPR